MSSNRLSMNGHKFEEEMFKKFLDEKYDNKDLDFVKSKIDDILFYELTDNQYNVLTMYYYQHLKQREIADTLQKDQSTVSRTLKLAKFKIGKILKYFL